MQRGKVNAKQLQKGKGSQTLKTGMNLPRRIFLCQFLSPVQSQVEVAAPVVHFFHLCTKLEKRSKPMSIIGADQQQTMFQSTTNNTKWKNNLIKDINSHNQRFGVNLSSWSSVLLKPPPNLWENKITSSFVQILLNMRLMLIFYRGLIQNSTASISESPRRVEEASEIRAPSSWNQI